MKFLDPGPYPGHRGTLSELSGRLSGRPARARALAWAGARTAPGSLQRVAMLAFLASVSLSFTIAARPALAQTGTIRAGLPVSLVIVPQCVIDQTERQEPARAEPGQSRTSNAPVVLCASTQPYRLTQTEHRDPLATAPPVGQAAQQVAIENNGTRHAPTRFWVVSF